MDDRDGQQDGVVTYAWSKLRPPWTIHPEVRGMTPMVEGASRWSSVTITRTLGRPGDGVVVEVVLVEVVLVEVVLVEVVLVEDVLVEDVLVEVELVEVVLVGSTVSTSCGAVAVSRDATRVTEVAVVSMTYEPVPTASSGTSIQPAAPVAPLLLPTSAPRGGALFQAMVDSTHGSATPCTSSVAAGVVLYTRSRADATTPLTPLVSNRT